MDMSFQVMGFPWFSEVFWGFWGCGNLRNYMVIFLMRGHLFFILYIHSVVSFFLFFSSLDLCWTGGWCHDLWPLLLSSRLGGRLSYLGTGIYTVRLGKSLSTSYLFVPPLIIYLLSLSSRLSPESSVTGSVLNLEIRSYNTRSRLKE